MAFSDTTIAEAWTPKEVFEENPEFNVVIEWFKQASSDCLKAHEKFHQKQPVGPSLEK